MSCNGRRFFVALRSVCVIFKPVEIFRCIFCSQPNEAAVIVNAKQPYHQVMTIPTMVYCRIFTVNFVENTFAKTIDSGYNRENFIRASLPFLF